METRRFTLVFVFLVDCVKFANALGMCAHHVAKHAFDWEAFVWIFLKRECTLEGWCGIETVKVIYANGKQELFK